MRNVLELSTSVLFLALALPACGDDGGGGDGGNGDGGTGADDGSGDGGGDDGGPDDGGSDDGGTGTGGTGDGGTGDGGTGTGTDDGGTGTGTDDGGTGTGTDGGSTGTGTDDGGTGTSTDGGDTGTDSTTDTGGNTGTTGGACTSHVVTYDLTGSVMDIDAAVDFTITVQEPYTDDTNVGPGTMKIRFTDDGGSPGPGAAQIVDYTLDQNFVTGSPGLATVTTDLETWSGPDACGTATGTLSGSTITWSPAEMDPLCQDGMVSCTGVFCGMGGSPPANAPFTFNMDCSGTMALNDFEFTNGVDNFTMEATVLSMDSGQTTTLAFVGTATGTEVDAATPQCACP